jgi:hypothetical protein
LLPDGATGDFAGVLHHFEEAVAILAKSLNGRPPRPAGVKDWNPPPKSVGRPLSGAVRWLLVGPGAALSLGIS